MQSVQVLIRTQLQWKVQRSPTSNRWIAACEPMAMCMEADSFEELDSLIDEAVQLTMKDLLQDNELEQFLQERGWQSTEVPMPDRGRPVEFAVPFELIVASRQNDLARSAH